MLHQHYCICIRFCRPSTSPSVQLRPQRASGRRTKRWGRPVSSVPTQLTVLGKRGLPGRIGKRSRSFRPLPRGAQIFSPYRSEWHSPFGWCVSFVCLFFLADNGCEEGQVGWAQTIENAIRISNPGYSSPPAGGLRLPLRQPPFFPFTRVWWWVQNPESHPCVR